MITYSQQLKELLNRCTFYKASDGKEYTPRKDFEDTYTLVLKDPELYYAAIEETADKEAADSYREEFKGLEGEELAFRIVEAELSLLSGGTLDIEPER